MSLCSLLFGLFTLKSRYISGIKILELNWALAFKAMCIAHRDLLNNSGKSISERKSKVKSYGGGRFADAVVWL